MAAEDETTQQTQDMPAVEEQTHHTEGQSPMDAHAASPDQGDPLPLVGAAFVGGIIAARILKKLGGD